MQTHQRQHSMILQSNGRLKTFKDMVFKKTHKNFGLQVVLEADLDLFAKTIVIAQTRELDTEEILKHCLGPVPWVPATAEGALRKTVKSSLAEYLKKNLATVESLPANSAWPMDRIYVVQ